MFKIGILFEYGTLNGGEHSMLAAIDHFDERFEIIILAPEEGPLSKLVESRGLKFQPVQLRQKDGSRISEEQFHSQLNQIAIEFRLDLIHANSLTMGRHLGRIARQLTIPTTSHIRDIMSLSKSAIRELNQHQKLIAVSDATREFHIRQGIDSDRIERIYNGVDCKRFQPRESTQELRTQLSLAEDTFLIATIGQICLRKAQADLAAAAVLLNHQHPNLHYLLVGKRHSSKAESIAFDERITSTFQKAGMSHQLHRLGYMAEIPELLNEIDLLVHPARQEPLGRVLLEAAASGTPVVATNVGGTPEIFQHQQSALLVDPGNPAEIARAITEVIQSPNLKSSLATQARAVANNKFNIHTRAIELANTWKQILE